MEFIQHSFRYADVILNEPNFKAQYQELTDIIKNVTDDNLIINLGAHSGLYGVGGPKSLSVAINEILRERFKTAGWSSESAIFQDDRYLDKRWRLDFAKGDISIEVAFNHGEATAWNLIKPVLASELNHVHKAIQTKIGVIITATNALKDSGGFDSAVGTYEKFLGYLPPLQNLLTTPILIIGLLPPQTFRISHGVNELRKKYAVIERFSI